MNQRNKKHDEEKKQPTTTATNEQPDTQPIDRPVPRNRAILFSVSPYMVTR